MHYMTQSKSPTYHLFIITFMLMILAWGLSAISGLVLQDLLKKRYGKKNAFRIAIIAVVIL